MIIIEAVSVIDSNIHRNSIAMKSIALYAFLKTIGKNMRTICLEHNCFFKISKEKYLLFFSN
jgi:hypothetical protein